jgi:hypothetical protein
MFLFTFKEVCNFDICFLFKIAFWTLAFVLSHPDIHKAIKKDISSVFGTAGTKPELICIIDVI